jgi:hypothetical protein
VVEEKSAIHDIHAHAINRTDRYQHLISRESPGARAILPDFASPAPV